MDPIELLDILGNENRRRILQLLSFRPFYFNEIAKRLDVGPKAIIDHLDMLERSGLIECYHDQSRRKYFRIARNTVLEIAVSPHSYGVRAYRSEGSPESRIEDFQEMNLDIKLLKSELSLLEDKRRDLRRLMNEIEVREAEIKQRAVSAVRSYANDQLESEILTALLSGASSSGILAEKLEVPEILVDDRLRRLEARGAVRKRGEEWSI
ncbi:MAG: ArsR family transcriptional regulator [Methanotrichaceae archaeon]